MQIDLISEYLQKQAALKAKLVAKLRELKTDNNLLLLWTNMDAGHGGASGRFQQYKEIALQYAFVMDLVGIKE